MQESSVHSNLMLPVVELGQPGPQAGDTAPSLLQREIERGLRFAHVMMSINQHEGREGVVFARALAELLVGKGLVAQEELETMMAQVRHEIEALPAPRVMLAKGEDKYTCAQTVLIDCANRVHLCKARCCTLDFFLSDQDLDEGIVRWDYGRPYWIARQADGYCAHCEPGTWRCHIHANRPYVCRAYDCRNDKRVWADFEARSLAFES